MPLRAYASEKKSSDESSDDDDDDDSSDSSSSDIDDLKRQIEESKAAKKKADETKASLASGMASVQQIIGSLQTEKNNVVTYVATLDAAMEQIQDDLNEVNAAISENMIQIEEAEKAIEKAQAALDEAEAVRQAQYESIKDQIHFMYTSEKNTIFSLIFSSKGIADLLNRTQYISRIMDYDQKKLAEYARSVEAAEDAKKLLEESKAKLDEKQRELEDQQAEQEEKESDMST
ncbi:MAG TPA: hypothetical protein DCP46_03815, partial [Lachnospiraceae bacterium]|nr:hypothetical protein [Lachnospiraceae bacterium]